MSTQLDGYRAAYVNHARRAQAVHGATRMRQRVAVQQPGRPLALDNHNKLAAGFSSLAKDLAKVKPERKQSESGGSLFGRLTGRG